MHQVLFDECKAFGWKNITKPSVVLALDNQYLPYSDDPESEPQADSESDPGKEEDDNGDYEEDDEVTSADGDADGNGTYNAGDHNAGTHEAGHQDYEHEIEYYDY